MESCTLASCPHTGLSVPQGAQTWVSLAHRVTCCVQHGAGGLSSSWIHGGNHPCPWDGGRETARTVWNIGFERLWLCVCATVQLDLPPSPVNRGAELGSVSLFYCQSHWLVGRGGRGCTFLRAKLLVPQAARTDILLQPTQPLLLARECFCQQGCLCV